MQRSQQILTSLLLGLIFPVLSFGEAKSFPNLEILLAKPEAQIDFAQAKLAIDLLIDSKQSSANTLMQINAWAGRVILT